MHKKFENFGRNAQNLKIFWKRAGEQMTRLSPAYLAAPQATFGHSQGGSLTNPMPITAFYLFQPEGHWEP